MYIYGYPNLGYKRSGLGNLLVMWARCEVFCRDHHCPMLAPQWTQPKIGPMLRGERDLRFYTGIFKHRPDYIRGLKRHWLVWRAPRIDETKATAEALERAERERRPTLVEFRDETGLLASLIHDRDFVARQLDSILSDATRRLAESQPAGAFIAAHVRRGDKPLLKHGDPIPEGWHWTLPDEWYIRVIQSSREKLGESVPVRIFSDARPQQLERLLALPNVTTAGTDNAMSDILLLSRASALITSGTSTFSMWAAYLGGMPTVWFPTLRTSLNAQHPWYDVETDLEGNVPDGFARAYREFVAAVAR